MSLSSLLYCSPQRGQRTHQAKYESWWCELWCESPRGVMWVSAMMLTCVTLLMISGVTHATVAYRATVKSLTTQADLIVHVVIDSQSTLKERGSRGEIYTQTILNVRSYWKGRGPSQLILQQLGGRLDDLRLSVEGDAHLKVGQEAILFLKKDVKTTLEARDRERSSTDGEHLSTGTDGEHPSSPALVYLISLAQGAYIITPPTDEETDEASLHLSVDPSHRGDPLLSQDLSGLSFYNKNNPNAPLQIESRPSHSPRLRLSHLKREVQEVIEMSTLKEINQ